MKTKFFVVGLLLLVLSSCNNDDEIINSNPKTNLSTAKVSVSGNQTVYEVDPTIISSFQHFCQRDAGPYQSPYAGLGGGITLDQAKVACGPTSYMMAAACLAKWIDPNTQYTSSATKLGYIINITNSPADLKKMQWYGNTYDKSFLTIAYNDVEKTSRSQTNQFIKNALTNNKFVIVGVTAYVNNYDAVNNLNLYGTSSNPDLTSSGDVTTGINRNYISSQNEGGTGLLKRGGHIIVLVRLVTNPDGTGIVEYIDPLARTKPYGVSNRRYVSFSRLLTSMEWNGDSDSNLDAISVGKK